MTVKQYIYLSLLLAAIDCVGITVWQIYTSDFDVVPAVMLTVKLLLDGIFVFTNWRRVQFRTTELWITCWILVGAGLGGAHVLMGSPEFLFSRILKDTVPALLFVTKIAIFRNYFYERDLKYGSIVIATLVISVANIVVFYALGGENDMYVGLTPPVNPILAGALAYSSATLFLVGLVVIYYSGKRSYLVSALVYLVSLVVASKKLKSVVSRALLIRISTGLLVGIAVGVLMHGAIVEKLTTTASGAVESEDGVSAVTAITSSGLDSDDLEKILYLATAGRSAEAMGIIDGMNFMDWLVGHGAGFTYSMELLDGSVRENYANAHFSPLGLTYKYGAPFALFLYFWLVRTILRNQAVDRHRLFWRGVAILMFVQSFFAFNLFVEFLFPIALAAIQTRRNWFSHYVSTRSTSSPMIVAALVKPELPDISRVVH